MSIPGDCLDQPSAGKVPVDDHGRCGGCNRPLREPAQRVAVFLGDDLAGHPDLRDVADQFRGVTLSGLFAGICRVDVDADQTGPKMWDVSLTVRFAAPHRDTGVWATIATEAAFPVDVVRSRGAGRVVLDLLLEAARHEARECVRSGGKLVDDPHARAFAVSIGFARPGPTPDLDYSGASPYPTGTTLGYELGDARSVFVFGSNLAGRHGAGAALHAARVHGAIHGRGEGRQGRSYAIPTKDEALRILPLPAIRAAVERFLSYAAEHPRTRFAVTRVGCGLAGYTDADIAPMFAGAPGNCDLPTGWRGTDRAGR